MEFKDKMIYARAMLKYRQAKMAEELGVSFATINRWENGNNSPSKTIFPVLPAHLHQDQTLLLLH